MTREVLEKVKESFPSIYAHITNLKYEYKNAFNSYVNDGDYGRVIRKRDAISYRAYEYTLGLRDAGLISERERQILFLYTTA